jgi:hypothetical protein
MTSVRGTVLVLLFADLAGGVLVAKGQKTHPARKQTLFTEGADKSGTNGQTQSALPTTSFAGCYELKLGRWWPWAFGGDTIFVTPPSRIQLLSERGTKGFEQDGFLIRAIPPSKGAPPCRGSPSYWQVKSSDQINLVWTDGFTGVTLALEKHGNELRGWAHPHFDAPKFIPRIAHVTARRIVCDAPQ